MIFHQKACYTTLLQYTMIYSLNKLLNALPPSELDNYEAMSAFVGFKVMNDLSVFPKS